MKSILFAILLIVTSSCAIHPHLKYSQKPLKLTADACRVAKDILTSQSSSQDVLIGNLIEGSQSFMVNDVAQCVGDKNPAIITDFKTKFKKNRFRQTSLIILMTENFEVVNIKF